jgi:hypothetical protein
MAVVLSVVHKYVAPFLVGVFMAAATVVVGVASVVALVVAAGVFAFLSLPAGARMMSRHSGAAI